MTDATPASSDVCLRFLGQFSTVQNLTDVVYNAIMGAQLGPDLSEVLRKNGLYRTDLRDEQRGRLPLDLAQTYNYSVLGFTQDYKRLYQECRQLRDDLAHSEFVGLTNVGANYFLTASSRYRIKSRERLVFTVGEMLARVDQARWMEVHLLRLFHEVFNQLKDAPIDDPQAPPVPPANFEDFAEWRKDKPWV